MALGEDEESPSPGEASRLRSDLADSHRALLSLTWVGTTLFVALCIVQSALSFWPYLGGDRAQESPIMFHLQVAGFVASCAAIYNLVIVERAFGRHLTSIVPASKFLTVKLLVSLSFLQRGMIGLLQSRLLPDPLQRFLSFVPVLRDIVDFSDLQLHLFYPALTIFECLFLSIAHLLVWRSNERWYHECPSERSPLLAKPAETLREPS